MEGSAYPIPRLLRAAVPVALVAGAVAVAGCGGSGGGNSAKPSAPLTNASSSGSAGGVVTPAGTSGLIGPVTRATSQGKQFDDLKTRNSPNANHRTPAQRHGVATGAACSDGDITPSPGNVAQLNAAILCLLNAERSDAGLPALTENAALDKAAQGMAQQMVAEHFFAHVTPEGKDVVDRIQPTGYIPSGGDWVVGENLAWGSGALSTPQAIVNGWMNSPGHKANILAPDYKDIGLAVSFGTVEPGQTMDGTTYVNEFGAKSGADLNLTLPPENGTSAAKASVKTTTSKKHHKKKHKKHHKKKHHKKHRKHRTSR